MSRSGSRLGRSCSRAGCGRIANKTLTYIYADSVAVLGPLATFSEPHAYDLCEEHSVRMSAPRGWTVIKQEQGQEQVGPTNDDLMAIADAIRIAGARTEQPAAEQGETTQPQRPPIGDNNQIGRRGHLRAIPN